MSDYLNFSLILKIVVEGRASLVLLLVCLGVGCGDGSWLDDLKGTVFGDEEEATEACFSACAERHEGDGNDDKTDKVISRHGL